MRNKKIPFENVLLPANACQKANFFVLRIRKTERLR